MSELKSDDYYEAHADFCSICGNANRLKVLDVLKSGESYTVSELTESTGITQSTLSQHLKLMRDRGMVTRTKEGVNNYYRIKDERIVQGMLTIRQVVEDQIEE
jgi:DNA-binding transcriptional ArsR family regulator